MQREVRQCIWKVWGNRFLLCLCCRNMRLLEGWVCSDTRDLRRPISKAAQPLLRERGNIQHLPPDCTQPAHSEVTRRRAALAHTSTLIQIFRKGAKAAFVSHHQHQSRISLPRSNCQDVPYPLGANTFTDIDKGIDRRKGPRKNETHPEDHPDSELRSYVILQAGRSVTCRHHRQHPCLI